MSQSRHGKPTTRILGLCGIDGAGKSSLIARLHERDPTGRVLYVKKDVKRCNSIVQELHARPLGDYRDLNNGNYGSMLATADALDFLDYYRTSLRPEIESGRWDLIVHDRYTPCYAAYLDCVAPHADSVQLFAAVRPADLIVLIEVDQRLLANRYRGRGGAEEDENPEMMARFAEAYYRVLPLHAKRVIRIENNGHFQRPYMRLVRLIRDNFGINVDPAATGERTVSRASESSFGERAVKLRG
jgi:thymidylate kinase